MDITRRGARWRWRPSSALPLEPGRSCAVCRHRWRQMLFSWDSRVDDWRDDPIHMILVAQQTILTRHAAGVTALAELLFHRTKIGHEKLRIALLVALQIGAASFKIVAGQA